MKTTHHSPAKQNDRQYAIEKIEATLEYLTHPHRLTAETAAQLMKDFAKDPVFCPLDTQKVTAAAHHIKKMADDILKETRLNSVEIDNLILSVYYYQA